MNLVHGIKGFLGISLIDYPGKVAAVVFLSGCNLRCPFCHNSVLVERGDDMEDLQLPELIGALERRRKLLDGVVVTGGEPTVHPQLTQVLRHLRQTGLSIKLDTNGMRTSKLAALAGEGLLDYVAVDVKVAPERYPEALQAPPDAARRLAATVDWLRVSGLAHEFRTTIVPGLVQEEDIRRIAALIAGAPAYYLQQYRPTHVDDPVLRERPPYPVEVLERFKATASRWVPRIALRNV